MSKKKNVGGTIDQIKDDLNKMLGEGTVTTLDSAADSVKVSGSGSYRLDEALGGGYAVGRVIEIYGPESSGKTTLAIHAMVESQKLGGTVLMLDLENAFDPEYAESVGLDLSGEKFIFSQPETGEDAFTILERFVSSGGISMAVVDSIAAMIPKAELEGEFGESKMGLHARLMSQGMRKLVGKIKSSNTTVIFINQIRMKIGVLFGNPETTTGGMAMRFYASQRVEVRKKSGDKDNDGELTTNICTIKVVKNKIAPPHRSATLKIRFGIGIDSISELIEIMVELDLIKKSGSWYSYDGVKLGQGFESVRDTVANDPDLRATLEESFLEEMNG